MSTAHLENLDPAAALRVKRVAVNLEDEFKEVFSTETIERFLAESNGGPIEGPTR